MDAEEARRRAEQLAARHFERRSDATPGTIAGFVHREAQRLLTGQTVVDPYRPQVRPRGRQRRTESAASARPAAAAMSDLERLLEESMKEVSGA